MLVEKIRTNVFLAELPNGHRFVSLVGHPKRISSGARDIYRIGDRIVAKLEPGNMARGVMISGAGNER